MSAKGHWSYVDVKVNMLAKCTKTRAFIYQMCWRLVLLANNLIKRGYWVCWIDLSRYDTYRCHFRCQINMTDEVVAYGISVVVLWFEPWRCHLLISASKLHNLSLDLISLKRTLQQETHLHMTQNLKNRRGGRSSRNYANRTLVILK